jgi:hypothetical protein
LSEKRPLCGRAIVVVMERRFRAGDGPPYGAPPALLTPTNVSLGASQRTM